MKSSPLNLIHFAFLSEPRTIAESDNGPDAKTWKKARAEELESHDYNNSWTLTKLPPNRKAIKSKWVFKWKRDQNGAIIRHKARLVAKGCSQVYGIDYDETFSPVVRYASLRLLFALAVRHKLMCYQMDFIPSW